MNLSTLIKSALSVMLFIFTAQSSTHAQSILYVDAGSTAVAPNGTSWASAFPSLQQALSAINSNNPVQQIWVKKGTYYPSVYPAGTANTDVRNYTFLLKSGVAIYGGFDGTETSLSQRNFRTNLTVLSGDIGVRGDTSDNCYHVVVALKANNATRLDGFTVRDGRASQNYAYGTNNGTVNNNSGGGLYVVASNMVVTNCNFIANSTTGQGAGIFTGLASPILPEITNCVFVNNIADAYGAGISVLAAAAQTLAITNCIFYGNTAPTGVGIVSWSSTVQVTNCTFANNKFTSFPGYAGIYASGSTVTVANSILWGYTGIANATNNVYGSAGSNAVNTITNSLVQGGYAGSGNLNADPLFAYYGDGDGADNIWGTSDDGLHLRVGSPAVNAGNNAAVSAAITTDIANVARIQYSVVDMGAYEDALGVLPLQLLSFSASKNNGDVLLQWKTSGEENTDLFQIERSNDGKEFTTIGKLPALNMPGNHNYYFKDGGADGLNDVMYYRLKIADRDGRYTYSAIATVSFAAISEQIKISPNPATTQVTLECRFAQPDQLQVLLINNTGQVVQASKYEVSAGTTFLRLAVANCRSGMYYVKIKGSKVNMIRKLSIQ